MELCIEDENDEGGATLDGGTMVEERGREMREIVRQHGSFCRIFCACVCVFLFFFFFLFVAWVFIRIGGNKNGEKSGFACRVT